MAYVFTQVFTGREKWIKLTKAIKEQVLQRMISSLSTLAGENRVQLIAIGQIEGKVSRAVDAEYYVTWSVPINELTSYIVRHFQESEWNEYFELVNIGGKALTIPQFAEVILRE